MTKICARICLLILPVLFVIGMFRVVVSTENSFLPSPYEFINTLESSPSILDVIHENVLNINNSLDILKFSFSTINGFVSFFNAIGNLFTFIGVCIMLVVNTLGGVLEWFIWFFKFLFGF